MRTPSFVLPLAVAVASSLLSGPRGLSAAQAPGKSSVFAGHWTLDVAKSTYSPGPTPKSQHATLSLVPNGIRTVAERVEADGSVTRFDWTGTFDRVDRPVTGDPNRDTVSLRRIDEYTIEFTNKKAGRVTTTIHAEYAKDGRSRVETTTGTNAKGRPIRNVTYWTKD